MDCIRYPKLIHLITESLYLLTNISTFPHSLGPDNHQSVSIILVIPFINDITIFVFLCIQFSSVQFSLVAQSCPTHCDPMNRSTPGLPVHHQLPESNQTHVHRVGDAIQPPHPLSSPSPLAPNPSQHQSLFQ